MSEDASDDPRLSRAVQDYLAELEAGRKPDRAAFLSRHPDLAGPLAECLDGLDLVHRGTATEKVVDGQPLGDFKLHREIGRGGMGVIYEATQLSLGRRVALKVLPFAATFDPRQLQRFENEAKAAAQLHHNNIVPVHAVGCERGVHFYAMQLIEGQSLAEVVGQMRLAGTGEPSSELSTTLTAQRSSKPAEFYRAVARFAVQAAEGLEYAHQVGIVHRDVKPANLLVDARGRLWITDFGLAQFHADAGLTRSGDLLGTLRYMSPEQAGGRRAILDHRADIYSLGATLYELVTLRQMFEGNSREDLINKVLNAEPAPPRALVKDVPVELETIILKAVSKDPGERYASAKDFAADLTHFIDDEPIQARRPSAVERARKWSRKHPGVVAAVLLVLTLAVAGLSFSNRLISDEQARTEARAAEAEEQFRLARRAVDELIQIADEELADNPQMEGLRKRLLDSALSYYQEFIAKRQDDPDLEATRDRVKKILADLAALQGVGLHYLLNESGVLDDLKVPPEAREPLAELLKELAAKRDELFREMGPIGPADRSRHFLERARADDAAVAARLTPTQLTRLGQIALQAEGSRAFRKPEVVSALKLSTEQRDRIRGLEMELGPQGASMFIERFQSELSDAQRKRWKELAGDPFKGTLPRRFPQGPRPGPPRNEGPRRP